MAGHPVENEAERTHPRRLGRRDVALLVVLGALAAVLRFYHLGLSSVWIDEGASVFLARLPWRDFVETLWRYEANMTAYYLLLRGWIQMGDSEAMIRSLSALCGVAGVIACFFAGRRLFGARVGFLSAALLTIHLFHLWLSQEARSYALIMLLVTLSLLLFARVAKDPTRGRDWVAYVAITVVASYSHLFATLAVPAQWLALDRVRLARIGLRRTVAVGGSLAVLLSPLAAFVLTRDQGQLNWIPPLDLPNVLLALFGITGFNPLLLLVVLIGVVLMLRRLGRSDEDSFGLRLAGLGFALPLVIVALVSLWKPLFHFRYFAVCVPAGAILAARVLSPAEARSKMKRVLATVGAVAVILVSGLMLVGYYQRFPNWAGDWRSTTDYVLSHRKPGDALVFWASAGLDSYRYYRDRVPGRAGGTPLPEVVFPPPGALASEHLDPSAAVFLDAARDHSRVWVILHLEDADDLPRPFPKSLHPIEERDFTSEVAPMPLKLILYESDGTDATPATDS